MTAIDRPRTPGFALGNRQLQSTRPDLIRKITVLRQRLAALEGVLASSDDTRSPDAGGHHGNGNAEIVSVAFADGTPSPRLRNGAGRERLRRA